MKTLVYVLIGIGLWIVINLVFLNCYPMLICCTKEVRFENYKIVFCDDTATSPTLAETEILIKDAEKLIQKSELFNPKTAFKIFIKNDQKQCPVLPRSRGAAKTFERIKNFFFKEENFGTMTANGNLKYDRPLSSIMAHQFTHEMIEDHFGWLKTRFFTLFGKNSRTATGLLWKEEGYADYISNNKNLNIKNLPKIEFPELDTEQVIYFKSYVAIKYLLEVQQLNIKQIISENFNLNSTYEQAYDYYKQL